VNQNKIIASLVRGAAWQLMRRSPTWLLIAVHSPSKDGRLPTPYAGAWLLGSHQW
jgi:hypothetical protein